MNITRTIKRKGMHWHRLLGQVGGIALLIFAVSGLLHPIMSWTGPKAAAFFPPHLNLEVNQAKNVPAILQRHQLQQAVMMKVVPSKQGALLQVTEHAEKPRRYFDLASGNELIDYDQQQAIWLARYYSGFTPDQQAIQSIAFQTEFDAAYPWVNRLLPVYRITFDSEDQRTLFIYTELNALAQITNDQKTALQTLFRTLHTWSWLDQSELSRVLIMSLLLLLLITLSATGIALLMTLKHRAMSRSKKVHRMMGYVISLPLLMLSISGTYHLLQYAYGEHHRGLQLGKANHYDPEKLSENFTWLNAYKERPINALSLLSTSKVTPTTPTSSASSNELKQQMLYRLSFAAGHEHGNIQRHQRFQGQAVEKASLYVNAETGTLIDIDDRAMALHYAELWRQAKSILNAESNTAPIAEPSTKLITHFGPGYDFRNKRLPVWEVAYATENADRLFIDPASGLLVDHSSKAERWEGLSFSFLHKWNFLTPVMGREKRDLVIAAVMILAIVSALVGYYLLFLKLRKSRGASRQPERKPIRAPSPVV